MEIELGEMRECVKKILDEINTIPAEKLSQYRIVQQMNRTIYLVHNKKPDAFTGGRVSDEEMLDGIGSAAAWFILLLRELRNEMKEQSGFLPSDFSLMERFKEATDWYVNHKLVAPLPTDANIVFACMAGWCNSFAEWHERKKLARGSARGKEMV